MQRNGEGTVEKERYMMNANVSKLRSQVCPKFISCFSFILHNCIVLKLKMNTSSFSFFFYWNLQLLELSIILTVFLLSFEFFFNLLSANVEYTLHETVITSDSCNSGHSKNYETLILSCKSLKFPTKWYRTLWNSVENSIPFLRNCKVTKLNFQY